MKFDSITQTTADWQALKTGLHRFVLSRVPHNDAEDVVSDILEAIVRHRNSLRHAANPSAWIFAVARNKITDFYRNRSRQQNGFKTLTTDPTTALATPPASLPQAPEPTSDTDENPAELAACLSAIISDMAETDQIVLHEIDLKNTRQTDFAARHGIALPTVKSRIQRARKRLRNRLIACCPDRTSIDCDTTCPCTA